MTRSLALLLVGLWVGLLLASWGIAVASFQTADSILGPGMRPEVATRLGPIPAEDRRQVLRFLAAEMNRWMFRTGSVAQLTLGMALLLLVFRSEGTPRLLAGVALGLTLVQAGVLSPSIARLGRSLDFVARPLPPEISHRFGLLHGAYVLADLLKGVSVACVGWVLARLPPM